MRSDPDLPSDEPMEWLLQEDATGSLEEAPGLPTAQDALIVPIETFYLVGIRLNGRAETPDFYTFLFEQGGETRPLLSEGQVVVFTHLQLAETALGAAGIVARFRSLNV